MTVGDYLRLFCDKGVNMETPESKLEKQLQANKMGVILPPENTELKEIARELKHISQELNALNKILKQRR